MPLIGSGIPKNQDYSTKADVVNYSNVLEENQPFLPLF
jgi:hypothetical protein